MTEEAKDLWIKRAVPLLDAFKNVHEEEGGPDEWEEIAIEELIKEAKE